MRRSRSKKSGWRKDPLLLSIIGTAILLALLIVTMFLYRGSGPITVEIPWFVPLVNTFLLVAALSVAFLAFSRFHVLQCPVSYWLGVASVILAVGLVFYVLTWPGLAPGGRAILGHLSGTSGWAATIAQTLLALFLLVAVLARRPRERMRVGRLLLSVAGWLFFAASIHMLFLHFAHTLPLLIRPNGSFTPTFLGLHWVALAMFAAGLVLSTRRYLLSGNSLVAYVAFGQMACACAILMLIIGAKRYDPWWYLARILVTSGYLAIMFGLLAEYVGLFRREQEKSRVLDETSVELRESRDRLILAQHAGHVGIFDWDMIGGKLIWTAQLEEMFGLPPGGFEGNYEGWAKRLYPGDRTEIESQFQQWVREQRPQVEFEHRILRADTAEVRWMAVKARITYLADGTPARMLGTKLDITERKRAEEALKRSESMMSQAGGMASLGAWGLELKNLDDLDKNPLHWSDEVYRIFGYDPGSVEVTNALFWYHVHPDDRQRVGSAVAEALKEKRPYRIEHRIIRRDGGGRVVMEHAEVRFDGQGRPLEMVGAVQDITERKWMEEKLRKAHDELEFRVRERTEELIQLNRELQEFAFVASHDLSEPLRKIQAFGSLLKEKSGDRLTEQERDYVSRMTGAATRMQELLEALLRYSRIETRGEDLKPTNLNEVVEDVASDLEIAIRELGAQMEIGRLPTVEGDSNQLRQLFQNLIANAVKYHRPDVKTVIRIYGEENGTGRVFVEDNGIGFDESYLEKIFQPFQRLHGRNEYPGIGMGLAICRKIVERHGGTITARSTPGKGSTFIVTLPVNRGE